MLRAASCRDLRVDKGAAACLVLVPAEGGGVKPEGSATHSPTQIAPRYALEDIFRVHVPHARLAGIHQADKAPALE